MKKTRPKRRVDKVLSVRMPTETYDGVVKRANRKDMSLAEYMRFLIRLGELAHKTPLYFDEGDYKKMVLIV